MTIVEDVTETQTKIRLIDPLDWARLTRHHYPLEAVSYTEFCVVQLDTVEIFALMRYAGYTKVGHIGDAFYIVLETHTVECEDKICESIADLIFETTPHVVRVAPAGITSLRR